MYTLELIATTQLQDWKSQQIIRGQLLIQPTREEQDCGGESGRGGGAQRHQPAASGLQFQHQHVSKQGSVSAPPCWIQWGSCRSACKIWKVSEWSLFGFSVCANVALQRFQSHFVSFDYVRRYVRGEVWSTISCSSSSRYFMIYFTITFKATYH